MAPALLLGQRVDLRLERAVRPHAARLGDQLPALDVLALEAAQQQADVVARLALVQQLLEHLDAGDRRLGGRAVADADDLDLVARLDDAFF